MNEGVELLLKRMDSNPEEFWPLYKEDANNKSIGLEECRFHHFMNNFIHEGGSNYRFLEPEDFNALMSRINKFRQDEFSAGIFSRIVGGTDLELKKLQASQVHNAMRSVTQTPSSYSAQQAVYQAQQAHVQMHRQAAQAQAAQAQGLLGNGLNSLKGFFGSNP